MATFVSTSLGKRTGATTTVFSPLGKDGDSGTLAASGTYAGLGSSLIISSKVNGSGTRISKVRIMVPQVDTSGTVPVVKSRPYIEAVLVVPSGTLQTDVNDLVGYLEKALGTATTNIDDVMVDGVGVY